MIVRSNFIFQTSGDLVDDVVNPGHVLTVDPQGGTANASFASVNTVSVPVTLAQGVTTWFASNIGEVFSSTITNSGTINWNGSGTISFGEFTNTTTGVFNISSSSTLTGLSASSQIANYGSLKKYGTPGRTIIDSEFANYGIFRIDAGSVQLEDGGSQPTNGVTILNSGTTLRVDASSDYTVSGGSIYTNGMAVFRGSLVMTGGFLVVGTDMAPSQFQVWGDYTQGANATLQISVVWGTNSQLQVSRGPNNNIGTGTATLNGQVLFLISQTSPPGATPVGGQPFLTCTARAGTFASWASTMPNGWNDRMGVFHRLTNIALNANGTDYDFFIN